MKLQIISKKRLRKLLVAMIIRMVVLSTIVSTVVIGFFIQWVVIVDYALVVGKDIRISGLIALAKPCFQFLIDTL